jgi:putative toxin-antitoxin system antitoxin component (TIGR02293 family)
MGIRISTQKAKRTPAKAGLPRNPGPLGVKKAGDGVVMFYVQGQRHEAAPLQFTSAKLIEALEAGLPFQELQILQTSLDVSTDRLAPMLGISKATFHRSKGAASRLNPAVSDRVVRYARLLGFAVKVFGNLEDAKQWLNSPQFGLGGAVPLDYAKTEIGAREVENLLGRIQYGVYS